MLGRRSLTVTAFKIPEQAGKHQACGSDSRKLDRPTFFYNHQHFFTTTNIFLQPPTFFYSHHQCIAATNIFLQPQHLLTTYLMLPNGSFSPPLCRYCTYLHALLIRHNFHPPHQIHCQAGQGAAKT